MKTSMCVSLIVRPHPSCIPISIEGGRARKKSDVLPPYKDTSAHAYIYVLIINFHSDFFCDFLYIMDPLRYWFNPPLNLLCNQTVTLGFISPIYLYFKLFFNCKSFVGSLIIEAIIHKLKTSFCLKECGICMS